MAREARRFFWDFRGVSLFHFFVRKILRAEGARKYRISYYKSAPKAREILGIYTRESVDHGDNFNENPTDKSNNSAGNDVHFTSMFK